jgi:hypothetical protein
MTDFLSKVIDWDINGNPLCTYEQQIRSMFGDLVVVYMKAAISHTALDYIDNYTPTIYAAFECESNGIVGVTSAPVKRVEKNDDGSFTVIIDHWPTT